MIITNKVVRMEPHTIGIWNNISKAMAPPKISAKEVEMEANTAVPNTGRESHLGQYWVAASLKHKPVTIPKWATLC